ncbi:hypothetical protein RND71_012131 [Anisodus tanguticus]|uniref:Uncharacterized protein n=1 Tax=Anisodus tanguticus TaxID=243964 RepID=A0AAE1SCM6_9SOLA|nr:hypothetical protein RND71_012131 [Anisodus tanguticus]
MERIDERSRFIISKLVNKIKELENYEHVRLHLDDLESLKMLYDDLNMNLKILKRRKISWMRLIALPFNMIISTSIRLSLKIQKSRRVI